MDESLTRGAPQGEGRDIAELSRHGYQLLRENLIERSKAVFTQILEAEPNNHYALVGMGDCLRKEGEFEKAITYYQDCLKSHKRNSYALFGLADCYKRMGQFNRAVEAWEEYLQYDSSNVTILTRMADAYRKVRNFTRSKEVYQRVLEIDPQNAYAHIGLGHLHYDFKEYGEALKYWQTMISSSEGSGDIRILTSIGNCYRKLKQFEEGVEYFQKALALQSHNFYALFGLADCYRGLQQQDLAIACWAKILDKDPRNKVVLTRVGDAYRSQEDFEKAEECYKKALETAFDEYAILGLGYIGYARGEFAEVRNSMESLIKRPDTTYRAYILLAECYEKMGEPQKAVTLLTDFNKQGYYSDRVEDKLREIQAHYSD